MNNPVVNAVAPGLRSFLVVLLLASPAAVLAHDGVEARMATAASPVTKNFHFENIPVRSALQLLAEEGQFNLVVSDSVTGNITLRLTDVTWEQALEIVLRMKGLEQRIDGAATVTVTGG